METPSPLLFRLVALVSLAANFVSFLSGITFQAEIWKVKMSNICFGAARANFIGNKRKRNDRLVVSWRYVR